jgi:hypothetical protein
MPLDFAIDFELNCSMSAKKVEGSLSGSTFSFESLIKCFPVTKMTYHLLRYLNALVDQPEATSLSFSAQFTHKGCASESAAPSALHSLSNQAVFFQRPGRQESKYRRRATQVNSCDICSVFFLKSRRQGEGPTAKWPACKSRLLFFASRKQPACDHRGVFFLKSRRQGWKYRRRAYSTLRTLPTAGNDELRKKTPR